MKVKELRRALEGIDGEVRILTIGEPYGGTFTSEPPRNLGVNGCYFDEGILYIMEGVGTSKTKSAKSIWKKYTKKSDDHCAGLIDWFKD